MKIYIPWDSVRYFWFGSVNEPKLRYSFIWFLPASLDHCCLACEGNWAKSYIVLFQNIFSWLTFLSSIKTSWQKCLKKCLRTNSFRQTRNAKKNFLYSASAGCQTVSEFFGIFLFFRRNKKISIWRRCNLLHKPPFPRQMMTN